MKHYYITPSVYDFKQNHVLLIYFRKIIGWTNPLLFYSFYIVFGALLR
jgi:hypothetical protein